MHANARAAFAALLAGGVLLAGAAFALADAKAEDVVATVMVAEGRVLASDGQGYLPVRDGQRLRGGDRLLLLPGARIELNLPQACRLVLTGPSMHDLRSGQACPGDAGQAGETQASAVRFDGAAFLARTGGLGRIEAESRLDTVGP
jgi:hypothetical protein